MDWATWAQIWGPAVPMFAVFVFYVHRLVFREIPRGFRALKREVRHLEDVGRRRHTEAMYELHRIEDAITEAIGKKEKPPHNVKRLDE